MFFALLALMFGPATPLNVWFELLSGKRNWLDFLSDNSSVLKLRLVHVILSITTGMALSAAGRAMQQLMQNPLADPHVVGLSAGSTSAVLLTIVLFPAYSATLLWDVFPALWISAALGSFIALILVQVVFQRVVRRWGVASLALVGLLLNASFSAFLMLIFARLSPDSLAEVQAWTLGSIQPHGLFQVVLIAPVLLLGALAFVVLDKELKLMSFGVEFASSHGVNVRRLRQKSLVILMLVSAAAVCAAGSVGFIGLLIPHLTRRLFFRSAWLWARPWLNVLLGGGFLLIADLCSRTLTSPLELPVGVYTALFSAPFLMAVLLRKERVA